jgi:hypothetical protein
MKDGRREGEERGSRDPRSARRILTRRMYTPARQSAKKAISRRRHYCHSFWRLTAARSAHRCGALTKATELATRSTKKHKTERRVRGPRNPHGIHLNRLDGVKSRLAAWKSKLRALFKCVKDRLVWNRPYTRRSLLWSDAFGSTNLAVDALMVS